MRHPIRLSKMESCEVWTGDCWLGVLMSVHARVDTECGSFWIQVITPPLLSLLLSSYHNVELFSISYLVILLHTVSSCTTAIKQHPDISTPTSTVLTLQ